MFETNFASIFLLVAIVGFGWVCLGWQYESPHFWVSRCCHQTSVASDVMFLTVAAHKLPLRLSGGRLNKHIQ